MSSRRRMSLGGGALRRSVLADNTSHVNVNQSSSYSRLSSSFVQDDTSFGTPQKTIGLDHESIYMSAASSQRRPTSVSRRQSFGGSGLLSHRDGISSTTPVRDRRAMLEAWRKSRGGDISAEVGGDLSSIDSRKRSRGDPPPLPPSSKQHRTGLSQDRSYQISTQILPVDIPPSNSTIHFSENDVETHSSSTARTPSSLRGTMGSTRRKSFMGKSIYQLSEDFDASQEDPMSQLTQENELDASTLRYDTADSVEGAGLASQMERMKQRVEQLEKEKMELSMSKAPLEARFRQKEDAWQKEKLSLMDQLEASKSDLRESDEKFRDLQEQFEQASAEVIHLRQEVRKASSSRAAIQSDIACSGTNSSLWSRQLQNDRDLADTKEKLRTAEEEIGGIRLAKVSLEKELHATRIELSCLERNYDELKTEYDEIAARSSESNEAEIKLAVLTEEHIATTAALNAVYADLDATKARADAAMKEKENIHKRDIEQLQFDLSVMKTRAGKMQNDRDSSSQVSCEEDEAVLRARIEEREKRIRELEAELLHGEQLRRQMHNTIQELRGNIRVYVRTRPFLPDDKQNDESPVVVSPDGESMTILDRRTGSPLDFKFDKVFPPSAGQELVFDEISDFVQSALDGYHVCLFSYGQTGSGKTHTMQGCGNGPMRGIIPRAVEKILDQSRSLNQHKWNFSVSASFLEIYNETLNDLLQGISGTSSSDKLSIKRNREGKSYVDGLAQVPIDVNDSVMGMEQLDSLMSVAARSRSVASTKMNSQSSRSHSVFMLHLNGYNEESGATVSGALNLCDLAGSERLDRSGAGSDAKRLRETQSINKSLSCLGDVFNALATGASHVPYRNSKLTYLLQDCLSGDGKALMFVNLSPTTASSGESVCSLRFAHRVNQVELGKATKHIEYGIKRSR